MPDEVDSAKIGLWKDCAESASCMSGGTYQAVGRFGTPLLGCSSVTRLLCEIYLIIDGIRNQVICSYDKTISLNSNYNPESGKQGACLYICQLCARVFQPRASRCPAVCTTSLSCAVRSCGTRKALSFAKREHYLGFQCMLNKTPQPCCGGGFHCVLFKGSAHQPFRILNCKGSRIH